MWKDAAVCCGRVQLNFFVRVWYDMCESLERESAMMFSVPLICFEYRDVSLLMRTQPIHRATALYSSSFTRSKDALCIQSSALELSVNAKMCGPCTSFRIVVYIDIDGASNSNRLSVIYLFRSYGIIHRHGNPLLL